MRLLKVLFLMVFLPLVLTAQRDLFSDMGSSQDEVRDQVMDALITGHFYNQSVFRAFLSAPLQTRLAWIKTVFTWARSYTRTQVFLDEYQTRRQENAPDSSADSKGSYEQESAGQQAEFKKQIAEMKKNLNQLPSDMRKQMEQTIQEMEKQFKEQQENPEFQALMKQGHEIQKKEQAEDRLRRQADFERQFPVQPRQLIARQLQRFLELAESVDFKAELMMKDGRKRFVDPAYEAKPTEWKLFFRAGRETVEVAMAEARTWLVEISRK